MRWRKKNYFVDERYSHINMIMGFRFPCYMGEWVRAWVAAGKNELCVCVCVLCEQRQLNRKATSEKNAQSAIGVDLLCHPIPTVRRTFAGSHNILYESYNGQKWMEMFFFLVFLLFGLLCPCGVTEGIEASIRKGRTVPIFAHKHK